MLHLVLTVGLNGHIFFVFDNASTLFRGMMQRMKLIHGLDNFVKHVLGQCNLCKYQSFHCRLSMTGIIQARQLAGRALQLCWLHKLQPMYMAIPFNCGCSLDV